MFLPEPAQADTTLPAKQERSFLGGTGDLQLLLLAGSSIKLDTFQLALFLRENI